MSFFPSNTGVPNATTSGRVQPITSPPRTDAPQSLSSATPLITPTPTSKSSQVAPAHAVWDEGHSPTGKLSKSLLPSAGRDKLQLQREDSDSEDVSSEVDGAVVENEVRVPTSALPSHAPPAAHRASGRRTPGRSVTSVDQGEVQKLVGAKNSAGKRLIVAVVKSWREGYLKAVLLWVVWLVTGTVFYAIRNDLGWGKGFYMMINVGYSIGWGYPVELDRECMWFSAMNVLVGATALSFSLKLFAEGLLERAKDWYSIALYESKMADRDIAWYIKTREWCWAKREELLVICIFALWVCFMVLWASKSYPDWKLDQGIYFAVSSLSTGGMLPIPIETADTNYVIVASFTAIGVPLMCLAMGNVVSLAVPLGDAEGAKKLINARITEEELRMMQQFGVCDGDGRRIERAEFMLLCAIRLGTVDIGLIDEIKRRYASLDADGDGSLSVSEILQVSRRAF